MEFTVSAGADAVAPAFPPAGVLPDSRGLRTRTERSAPAGHEVGQDLLGSYADDPGPTPSVSGSPGSGTTLLIDSGRAATEYFNAAGGICLHSRSFQRMCLEGSRSNTHRVLHIAERLSALPSFGHSIAPDQYLCGTAA